MNFLDFVISDLYKNIHQLGKNGSSRGENGNSESNYDHSESENGIFQGDLSNVIVVLPTRRAGTFLKQALGSIAHAQNGTDRDKPICAPQVTTINDLIDSLCPYRKADEIEVVCLLHTVYQHFIPNHSLSIDAFYGWGRQLIADFNNVDKSYNIISKENILEFTKDARKFDNVNIHPEVKARICQLLHMASDTNAPQKAEEQANGAGTAEKDAKTEGKGIKTDTNHAGAEEKGVITDKNSAETDTNSAETDKNRAETDIDEHSVREELEALWRKLPEIYDSLAKKLEERGAMLEGARNKWVVTHIEEVKKQLEGRVLVFAGFNFLLRTELTLMQQLKDAGMARFYWDYDPDFSQKGQEFSQKGQDFSQEEQGGSQKGQNFSQKGQSFSQQGQESFPVYQHIKKNLEALGGKYEQDTTLSGDNRPKKEIDLYSAQSDNAQAHLITDWLANHYAQEQASHAQEQTSRAQSQTSYAQGQTSHAQGQASHAQGQTSHAQSQTSHAQRQTCAVVLCNEQMLESAIFSVPPELSGEVNITKGFPMRNTPIFSQISKQLSTAAKRAVSAAKQLGTATKHAANAAKQLGTAAKRAVTPADMIQETLDLINHEREKLREKGFPEITEDADEFTWHQLLQAESLYQALQVVNSFARLLDEGLLPANITLPMLRNLILRHLGSVSIPFHGEPITDIQIIGVLETRALDFDNILLLNVEEGTLPRTSIDRSFIPYYIRKYYEMPTSDEDTEIYAYNFFRLLRRAKHISIAYSEAQSAEGQKQMSRFVLQMLTSPLFDCHRYLLSDNNALPQPQSEQAIHDKLLEQSDFHSYAEKLANTAADAASPSSQSQATAADAASPSSQTPPSLSPSAINTFLTCKMKFFIRYMLGINEPDSEDALLQANELGSLIHGALQAIYNAIKSRENGDVSPMAIDNVIQGRATAISLDAAIDLSIDKMNADYQKFHPNTASGTKYSRESHQIEVEVAKTHVKKVLENDKQNGGFRLIDTERDTYLTIDVSKLSIIAPNLKTLRIGGSIDRLDVVYEPEDAATGRKNAVNESESIANIGGSIANIGKDAVLRVIDYKTGSYDKKKMRTDSIDDLFDPQKTQHYVLQTFIYCLACLRDTSTSGQSHSISAQIATEKWKVSPRLLFTQKDLSQFDPHIYIKDKPVTDFENQEIPIQNQTPDVEKYIYAEFEAKLTEFVENLLSEEEFPMTTDVSSKSPCAYCPYKLLCGRTNVSGW